MSPDFAYITDLMRRQAGLVLTADKAYLLESRLRPLLRERHLADFSALTAALKAGREDILRDVTDALTTHETSFFRDMKPFQLFRQQVLPALLATRAAAKRLRIWSAACSTGQEPYSIAMSLLEEQPRLRNWTWEIVATDISHDALAKARQGLYSQFEVQRGMPTPLLLKYFEKIQDRWQVKAECRSHVAFRAVNLMQDVASLGQFDVVFCRNVLIYFDPPTKAQVLERIADRLAADGFLFLGGAETVVGVSERFAPEAGQRGLYRPAKAADAGARGSERRAAGAN